MMILILLFFPKIIYIVTITFTDEISLHNDQPSSVSYEPMRSSLLELKAQACNDKALMLIGQAKLQEAMKHLLRSLQCQPGEV